MPVSDWRIELVMVPVADVDRAREFYERIGFSIDHDQRVSDEVRFVQATPPGSACSIAFAAAVTGQSSGGRWSSSRASPKPSRR